MKILNINFSKSIKIYFTQKLKYIFIIFLFLKRLMTHYNKFRRN